MKGRNSSLSFRHASIAVLVFVSGAGCRERQNEVEPKSPSVAEARQSQRDLPRLPVPACQTLPECKEVERRARVSAENECRNRLGDPARCAQAEQLVEDAQEMLQNRFDQEQEERRARAAAATDAQIEAFIAAHPKLPEKRKQLLRKRTLTTGMTPEEVVLIYGKPADVNRSVGSWGTHEQWVYEVSETKNEYLYFENGKVTGWQD